MNQKLKVIFKCVPLILLTFIISACSASEEKDIVFIRHNLDDYSANTVPFEEGIEFTLTTEEILRGVEEPMLLEKVYDTEIHLVQAQERQIQKSNYVIQVGLDSELQQEGTMLSLFRLNNDYSHSRELEFEVSNEEGESGNFGHGGGDGDAPYNQSFHFDADKEELLKGEKWTFKVSGLYLLKYSKVN
ncbi:hypothetical protein [Ornithinibacillus californiensis]|uniref:hypothetical protein n=1 Tax=Ornithinibacillus californiensis TaxID=161536 RepID=UPI00064DA69E|nr:hypothetical protein [Ornithinibacillus californiensis]